MAKALTAKGVEALKPDPARRLEIPDAGLTGLYLVVQPTGAKSWALRYRRQGKPSKLTLGRWPVMGLSDARSAAGTALDKIDRGLDPAAETKAREAAPEVDRDTFAAVVETFMQRHARHNRRADDVAAMFRREVLTPWGARPFQSITKRDVLDVLDSIVDRGSPVTANRLRAHLNTLFNWAKGRDIVQANPLDGIRPPAPETPRDRVLSNPEIGLFLRACDGLGYPFGPLFRVLLLTGQRLREVAEATRSEIAGNLWTLPAARSKNGDDHAIPLSPEVLETLAGLPKIGTGRFLFTTTGASPVSGFTKAKQRLDAAMTKLANADLPEGADPVTIPPFTLHDLRRTAATGMAGLGFPPHVVEAVLNHKSGTRRGVAGVYNRYAYGDEKRQALGAWARFAVELAGDGGRDNVVRLHHA